MNLLRRGEDLSRRVNRRVAQHKAQVDKQAARLLDRASGLADRASGLADRVEALPAEATRTVTPRRKPRRRLLFLTLFLGLVGGYAIAYLGDREQGRARRADRRARPLGWVAYPEGSHTSAKRRRRQH